jgi:hypothetical protein
MTTRRRLGWSGLGVAVLAAATLSGIAASSAQGATTSASFTMVRTAGLPAACVPNAKATVSIVSNGPTETMTVSVSGLPANTDFDFFVIQQPAAPFGMSWYQGDIVTTSTGAKTQKFIGRFSIETFVVAPGSVAAPRPHPNAPFPDAASNPTTAPLHMFHLGLWFNSGADAAKAGCPNVTTPFNGTHNAGPQVLNTHNFGNLNGPLNKIH